MYTSLKKEYLGRIPCLSSINVQVLANNRSIIEHFLIFIYYPSNSQIYQVLQANGFSQCQARSKRSALLDLNVDGSALHQADYQRLTDSVQASLRAVRPDFQTNHKHIQAVVVANSDALDISAKRPVSQVFLQISVNNVPVNFYTQTEFDMERLVDELNYQNENSSLTILKSHDIYSRNYFFNLVSGRQVAAVDYAAIEASIQERFLAEYAEFVERNVSTAIIWQEEYVNADRAIVYGLSVLISVDNRPVDQLIELDRGVFRSLKEVVVSETVRYRLSLPEEGGYLQPISKALTFFSSVLVCRRDYAKFEALVERVAKEVRSDLDGMDLKVVVASQREFVEASGTAFWKVAVLVTLSGNNRLVDLRMDSQVIVER